MPLKRVSTYMIIFSLILISILITTSFLKRTNIQPLQNNKKIVRIVKTKYAPFIKTLTMIGRISSKSSATLIAKETGIVKIIQNTGTHVSKNTLIAELQNAELSHRERIAKNSVNIAKLQYERLLPLSDKGYVSKSDIELKKQAWLAEQQVYEEILNTLNQLKFYAPFEGLIGAYTKREGGQIKAGEKLVSVFDPTHLIVDIDLPCDAFAHIKIGTPTKVLGKQYSITTLQARLDEESHLCPAEIDIECKTCLIGQMVDVKVEVAHHLNSISIPITAMFIRDEKKYVYAVEQGKIKQVEITIGLQQNDLIEVTKGLEPNQNIVIEALERLSEGMEVLTVDLSDQNNP